MKINAPLQHHHTSHSSVKPAATQDPGIANCTKHSTQDTTSKTLETVGVVQDTVGVVQDTEPENMANPSLLRTNVLMSA